MIKSILITMVMVCCFFSRPYFYMPVKTTNRQSVNTLSLTNIGNFGMLRKERPGVRAHFHTGIDIKRPTGNFIDEPIFAVYEGVVISVRKDGPYAQLIIEHNNGKIFWTVYEHVAGIRVNLNDQVSPNVPVARFMNKAELNRYGWQFDHFHFEVLKIKPLKLKPDQSNPYRLYSSYSLLCLTKEDLKKYFYNPIEFLQGNYEF